MATVPVRYTTDEFDRCGSGPNLSAYEIWIVRPIGRFKPRHLLDVPKQFEVVEQKSLHYYQWIKQQEAKAYNSHARACRWSTWAIVMVDNKRFKFLKRIYRAGVKIEDGPELTLYANDRSGGDVEAKWHLSPSVQFATPLVDDSADLGDLCRVALRALREAVEQLERHVETSAAGKGIKLPKPRKRGVA